MGCEGCALSKITWKLHELFFSVFFCVSCYWTMLINSRMRLVFQLYSSIRKKKDIHYVHQRVSYPKKKTKRFFCSSRVLKNTKRRFAANNYQNNIIANTHEWAVSKMSCRLWRVDNVSSRILIIDASTVDVRYWYYITYSGVCELFSLRHTIFYMPFI